jgi:hypothetical protein
MMKLINIIVIEYNKRKSPGPHVNFRGTTSRKIMVRATMNRTDEVRAITTHSFTLFSPYGTDCTHRYTVRR